MNNSIEYENRFFQRTVSDQNHAQDDMKYESKCRFAMRWKMLQNLWKLDAILSDQQVLSMIWFYWKNWRYSSSLFWYDDCVHLLHDEI